MASYGAVSKAVYGMAQLHAPESEAEIGQEAERGVGNKRWLHARGVGKNLVPLGWGCMALAV